MVRALLDTNIIIHRENTKVTNQSIGLLYYWLDKLHYDKLIHPYSLKELRKYSNPAMQELYDAKLASYVEMKTIAQQSKEFVELLKEAPKTENDEIDNQLLCEVYFGRADILITEDRRMRNKAVVLGISDRVFSINAFIEKTSNENPALLSYKALSVKKDYVGNVDVNNVFFDSLRDSYDGFNSWFAKKSDEEAYICYSDSNLILGFLYLKTEGIDSDYRDIYPEFQPKKRLKVGTFKIESTGFRLGERFIKIIFDNAIERKVDEIYVTLFEDREELKALGNLLRRWGFFDYGVKRTGEKEERVLVKRMNFYDASLSVKENYPNINYFVEKRFLPIRPQYHTSLLPDSQLKTERDIDYIDNVAHRYALQKVYITWGMKTGVKRGDILVFYRNGEEGTSKKYTSVMTTVGVIDDIIESFRSKEDFMRCCENRSVFTKGELEEFWNRHRYNLCVVKFIYIRSFENRLNLGYLWDTRIVAPYGGPRPFDKLTDVQFEQIVKDSKTKLYRNGEINE